MFACRRKSSCCRLPRLAEHGLSEDQKIETTSETCFIFKLLGQKRAKYMPNYQN
jgi:hypothetical protein